MEQQLTHGPHHEEQDQPNDHVDEQQRRPSHIDGFARAHEQAGSDGSADGYQLDMSVFEAALQMLLALR